MSMRSRMSSMRKSLPATVAGALTAAVVVTATGAGAATVPG